MVRPSGGRRVTARGEVAGLASSGRDIVEFPRRAGLPEDERLPADPARVEWAGPTSTTRRKGLRATAAGVLSTYRGHRRRRLRR
ncbi:hypothetical protein [Streptomyces sp. CB02400]|uniref:hypothetical protein n=1 Tax=Streptomyces sp. CB02400 TaxID=1703944 RepID=UPI001F30499A